MPDKEILDISDQNLEAIGLLDRIRDVGELRVKYRGEVFVLTMTRDATTPEGRNFLVKGRKILD